MCLVKSKFDLSCSLARQEQYISHKHTRDHYPCDHHPPTDQFIHEINVGLFRLEADDTEHDDGGEDGGEGVGQTDDERVGEGVVVRLGVAGQSDESTDRQTQ